MAKRVTLKNNKGQTIVGLLNIPKGKPSFPAVIICHGFKGYKEQLHLQTLATELSESSIVALRPDFTNNIGKSFGKLEDIMFSQELTDLKSIINYLVKQKFVDKKRIGLVGHSLGGQLILHYAPTDKRVKVLVDLAGPIYRGKGSTNLERSANNQMTEAKKTGFFYIFSKKRNRKYKLKLDFYFDLLRHKTPEQVKKIKVPTLIIHGSKDKTVALKNSRGAYKLLKQPKKLVIIPGAPHTWRGKDDSRGKYRKKIDRLTVDWFKKYL
ncbi:MAG: hypothetical protein CMI53_03520 [Parcubacteria group bacterium]|nr:hypothetical protein [Parcubacteria group bacterium]|tara:strand:+ start:4555 stop:5355 length:801 start_codon:yes stop_codon:yes gene_type:complete